jgi:two-component system cell cycle sensor histidine kinase/response regulator CckA
MSAAENQTALSTNDALYAALLKADRSESLVPLAGGLAAELSELLTQVLGGIALGRAGDPAALAAAEAAALSAREVTRRLMGLGQKAEAGRVEVNSKVLLEEAIAAAGASHVAEITLNADAGAASVLVNRDELVQAFRALVRNAAEAMNPAPLRPRIQLIARNTSLESGQLPGLPAGDYVEFEVRDNGRGIPAAELERIWEPFFTTKKHGAGLGLPTVLAIVRRHGGQAGVDSTAGEGTVFTVFLPCARATASAGGERGQARFRTGRILVMDRDEKNRTVIAGLLERLNYKCDLARDADEAVQWYRRYWDIHRPFDAVILDLSPAAGNYEGESALARLLDLDPDVRAIAMAALPPEELALAAPEKGFIGWLAKPFQLSELGQALQTVMP